MMLFLSIFVGVAVLATLYMVFVYVHYKKKIIRGRIDGTPTHNVLTREGSPMTTPTSRSGMTDSDLERLEHALKKKLPDFYASFLKTYPDDLVDLGAPYNTVSELHMPNTVERLIEISDFENPPDDVLIVGVDGLGNCYYIILGDTNTRVYLFDHEDPTFVDGEQGEIDWRRSWDRVYENLDELIAELREQLKE